jgi:putative transposase
MSELYQSLSHAKWDCKYHVVFCHVVFVPKRRRKAIFGQTRRQLGTIFRSLARQKECQIIEGHLMSDIKEANNDAGRRIRRAAST